MRSLWEQGQSLHCMGYWYQQNKICRPGRPTGLLTIGTARAVKDGAGHLKITLEETGRGSRPRFKRLVASLAQLSCMVFWCLGRDLSILDGLRFTGLLIKPDCVRWFTERGLVRRLKIARIRLDAALTNGSKHVDSTLNLFAKKLCGRSSA